jgi:prepilin-type N-terminal cleavage/methylation domain-containing protein
MKKTYSFNKMKGLTIIELMIGMAILAIFIVTIARNIPVAQEQSRITSVVQMISDAQKGTTAFAAGAGVYTGATVTTLVARNLLPINITDGVAENPFGGDLVIASNDPIEVTISLTNIPEEAGLDLVAKYVDFGATYAAGTSTFSVTFIG